MGRDGVDDPGHDGAEDDVSLEVAALGDRTRDDGGAGRGKRALDEEEQILSEVIILLDWRLYLEKEECILGGWETDGCKVGHSYHGAAFSKGEAVAYQPKGYATCNQNVPESSFYPVETTVT